MKHVASLQHDVVFKKAFGDPEIFTAFVRDVVGVQIAIDKVEIKQSFQLPSEFVPAHVGASGDAGQALFAKDGKNRVIVNLQHARQLERYDTFLHYHCATVLEQVAIFERISSKFAVYSIIVFNSSDKQQVEMVTIDLDLKTSENQGLGEIPQKVIYLCPKYVNEETPAALGEWLRAINDTMDEQVDENAYQNPLVRRIFDLIAQDAISSEERARIVEEFHGSLLSTA